MKVTINKESRLYVFHHGQYVTCLGFEVCRREAVGLAREMGEPAPHGRPGSMAYYNRYAALKERARKTGRRFACGLSPQLVGLEGRRVRVETMYGETRNFTVGRSTGWIPCHLEIANSRSYGGGAAERQYKTVTVTR